MKAVGARLSLDIQYEVPSEMPVCLKRKRKEKKKGVCVWGGGEGGGRKFHVIWQ